MRVMIVDDEPHITRILERSFAQKGFSTCVADNGWKALALLLADPEGYDLLITDMRMPVLGGLELIKEIRAKGLKTPVILMTGFGSEYDADASAGLDIKTFMEKPLSLSDLHENVANVLQVSVP